MFPLSSLVQAPGLWISLKVFWLTSLTWVLRWVAMVCVCLRSCNGWIKVEKSRNLWLWKHSTGSGRARRSALWHCYESHIFTTEQKRSGQTVSWKVCLSDAEWKLHVPEYALAAVLHGHWFESGLDYLGNRKQEQGTHPAAALSGETGHGMCPDRGSEQEEDKEVFLPVSVCLCAVMPARVCVGLCQEMAELSGTRCLLHSLAVGVSVMRATEACLCGRVFLCILRMHMYCTGCAYLKHTIYIFSLQCFPVVTKGGYSGYSPSGSKRRPKAQNLHKNTHGHSTICTHTQSWGGCNTLVLLRCTW